MNRQLPLIIACIMLGLALLPMPYGYYHFLRIAITGASIWVLIENHNKNIKLPIGLFITAIAYNPIFRISFDREIWEIVNVITIIYFVYLIVRHNNNLWNKIKEVFAGAAKHEIKEPSKSPEQLNPIVKAYNEYKQKDWKTFADEVIDDFGVEFYRENDTEGTWAFDTIQKKALEFVSKNPMCYTLNIAGAKQALYRLIGVCVSNTSALTIWEDVKDIAEQICRDVITNTKSKDKWIDEKTLFEQLDNKMFNQMQLSNSTIKKVELNILEDISCLDKQTYFDPKTGIEKRFHTKPSKRKFLILGIAHTISSTIYDNMANDLNKIKELAEKKLIQPNR